MSNLKEGVIKSIVNDLRVGHSGRATESFEYEFGGPNSRYVFTPEQFNLFHHELTRSGSEPITLESHQQGLAKGGSPRSISDVFSLPLIQEMQKRGFLFFTTINGRSNDLEHGCATYAITREINRKRFVFKESIRQYFHEVNVERPHEIKLELRDRRIFWLTLNTQQKSLSISPFTQLRLRADRNSLLIEMSPAQTIVTNLRLRVTQPTHLKYAHSDMIQPCVCKAPNAHEPFDVRFDADGTVSLARL